MANAIYPKWKEALLQNGTDSTLDGNVKAVLLDATYTYSTADQYLSDIVAGERVAISAGNLASKTYVNGLFDAADGVTFSAVTGDQATQMALFIDTGVESTSRLVAFYDTDVTGLPVTPNGGDITLNFSASGIFQL